MSALPTAFGVVGSSLLSSIHELVYLYSVYHFLHLVTCMHAVAYIMHMSLEEIVLNQELLVSEVPRRVFKIHLRIENISVDDLFYF